MLAPSGEVFFLEVNTRLQVEHPVTELVCGLDLVALQIAIAEGAGLPDAAIDPPARGHAIEARIVAEDAAAGWRPQTGTVERFWFADARGTDGGVPAQTVVRVDSAVDPGDEVSPHYDSLLAKLIVHAATRDGAIRRLRAVLAAADIAGVRTNRDLLVRVLESDAFATVAHDTQLLDGPALDALAAPLVAGEDVGWAAVAAALAAQAERRGATLPSVPSGWRNVPAGLQTVAYRPLGDAGPGADQPPGGATDDPLTVGYRFDRRGALATLTVGGESLDAELVAASPTEVVLRAAGVRRRFTVHAGADAVWVGGGRGQIALVEQPRFPDPGAQAPAGSLDAPLPGTVLRVEVAEGDVVAVGQRLLVLEAMKMEHEVTALTAGTIGAVHVAVGDAVVAGRTLLVVDGEDEGQAA